MASSSLKTTKHKRSTVCRTETVRNKSGAIPAERYYRAKQKTARRSELFRDRKEKRITDECYREARDIMVLHRDSLETCAARLLEKEKINREEFEALFEGKSEESNGE